MITVYYTRAEALVSETGYENCLAHLDERRKEKVLRTMDKSSRVRSLATGELLYQAVCRYLGARSKENIPDKGRMFQTAVQPGGKPCFTDYPQVHFNLSHSGDYVCCAIGSEAVGVDIQKHVQIKEGLAKRFFTEEENRLLGSLETMAREELFFRMWSIKESYIKFTGQGMKQGIDTFEIDWEMCGIYDKNAKNRGIRAYFEEFKEIEGYSLCVCREKSETEISWCNLEEKQ